MKHSATASPSAPLSDGTRVGYGVPGFPCVFFQRMIWDDGELGTAERGVFIPCLGFATRLLPYALAFTSSLCIMILELVSSRLVARHVGSSLTVWTSVIGIILGGICLGNVLGGGWPIASNRGGRSVRCSPWGRF